jgi:hypothetical protein
MNLFTSTFFNTKGAGVVDNYPDATIIEIDSTFSGMGSFYLTQSNYDMITVDWGDGNIETFEGTYSNYNPSHFYDESKKYIIQIQGDSIESISFSYDVGIIRAIKCGSSLTSHENMFYECSNLAKVEEIFKIGPNSNSQSWMFRNCTSLTEITHNIFPDNGIILDAGYMFTDSGLSVVKNLIIPGAAHGHNLEGMFSSCNLHSFDFDSFFKYDDWLYARGDWMFQTNTGWKAEIPSQYFWDSNIWSLHNGMFSNCYVLKNESSIPSDWK